MLKLMLARWHAVPARLAPERKSLRVESRRRPQPAELEGEPGPSLRMFKWREALVHILRRKLLVHLGQCDVNGGMTWLTCSGSDEPFRNGAFRVVLN